MKKLRAFTIIFALAIVITLSACGFCALGLFDGNSDGVALATNNSYIQIPDSRSLSEMNSATVSSIGFYEKLTFDKLFDLPTTYYVKVTGSKVNSARLGSYYPVSYNGLEGAIFLSDFGATEPTLINSDTVDSVGEAPSMTLGYTSLTPSTVGGKSVDSSWTIRYLGEDSATSKAYVKCTKGEEFVLGSIVKTNLAAYTIPLHQVTADLKAAQSSGTNNSADGTATSANPFGDDKIVKTVLIIGIIIPAVLIVVLLFIPRRKNDDYDSRARKGAFGREDNSYRGNSRYDRGRTDYDQGRGYENDGRDYRASNDRASNDRASNDRRSDYKGDDYYRPRDYRDR